MRRRLFPSLCPLLLISFQLASASHAAPFAYISNMDTIDVSVIDMASNRVTAAITVAIR